MRAAHLALLAAGLCGLSCAPHISPQRRYLDALAQKYAGDAQGYTDALLALAVEQPESRAGRRARAVLHGPSMVSQGIALSSFAAALAAPVAAAPAGGSAVQDEAKQVLSRVAVAQKKYFSAHRRYCSTFTDCRVEIPARAHFYYFLQPEESRGGGDTEASVAAEAQIRALMAAQKLRPHVTANSFCAIAVGLTSDARAFDAWMVDQTGVVQQLGDAP